MSTLSLNLALIIGGKTVDWGGLLRSSAENNEIIFRQGTRAR